MLIDQTARVQAGLALTETEVEGAVQELTSEAVPVEQKADFLMALNQKGETAEEIAAFASTLRRRAIIPQLDAEVRQREILDVCGTGGDKLNTFNISTAVAIMAAAAGVTVAKHGNRAITSQAGSADVLEELGIPINLGPSEAAASLRDRKFAFFFAQAYHPAFKHIGPARKLCAERGRRTIFNFLGPLLNPAGPSAQLMGVPNPALCERIARVLQLLGTRRAMVVSGEAGQGFLDEISSFGRTIVAEFYQDRGFNASSLEAADFGLGPATLEDLKGGDRKVNAAIVRGILTGEELGPKRDAVLLNGGAALFVAGRAGSISEGIAVAAETIDSGRAARKLNELASNQAPGKT